MFKNLRLVIFSCIMACFCFVSAHSSGKPPSYEERDSLIQRQPKPIQQKLISSEQTYDCCQANDINECITTGAPWNPFGRFATKGKTYQGTPTTCESANCLCDLVPRSKAPTSNSCCCPATFCLFIPVECIWTASCLPVGIAWRTVTFPWQRSIFCCDTLIARAWACAHPKTYDPAFHIACMGC